ncbi:glycosyltransferase involved in cell wall biosynthesis [Lysobacter niastensis]|uniref:Glycosyltransferase involved in cell wall biosynthesis n=1 Tax=Lysobacter niastensis TaxID=380629 RepID=A0ABU1W998_9GAMM|nr:glycosyltransferase [Lysobacter niastensis]MDR7134181.1 glycosyltransferase involved in cell wall biosynthesis [Lysobacter niastensis]
MNRDDTNGHARVLMVMEGPYPPDRGGGAEAQVRTLTRAMHQRGIHVAVVAPLAEHAPQAELAHVDGVPVFRLRYPRLRLIGGPALWLALARFLYRHRDDFDVWHVHVARQWGVICAWLGPWLGKRVVIKVSGSWDLDRGALSPDSGWRGKLVRRVLMRADAWQAISQRIAATLLSRGVPQARIAAIPNAVDSARFLPPARPSLHPPRFLFIGRLVREKGLPTLLAAFADIAPRHPEATLTIVGTGSQRANLEADVQALGIAERVTFTGHRTDIEDLLAQATIGVLPSRMEGLSNTLLECMASGLPMVASRISGNEDFVHPGENGWLFEVGDRNGLAASLLAAASLDPGQWRAMSESARAAVVRQAGLDGVLNKLVALYDDEPAPVAAAVPNRSV